MHPSTGPQPNDSSLAQTLAAAFASRSVAAELTALRAAGVAVAPALPGDSEVFLDDPHSHANGMVAECRHPTAGRMRVACNSITFAGRQAPIGRATPLLGEQSAEIMREVGFTDDQVATLVDDGTVKVERPQAPGA
jgi:formyl-CoA transferase